MSPDRLSENGFDPEAPLCMLWMELTQTLIGFPRHLSQHPGGFVIARDDLARLVPVENAAMADRSVIQWDKDDLDALGLIKVDILALGMLSALRRALRFVGDKLRPDLACTSIPDGDTPTFDMVCAADTVGVFQIESRAQMSMLPRLQPRCYYDLVIEVAIVRPGPIQGGMVHPYLRNRKLPDEQIDCPEELKPALVRTLGVPIFQEQVMQIAMLAADFTPGEADALRRAMAAWKRKGGLGPFHERLVGRMVEKGYDSDFAERIFKQIQGFGEYGFPESHAASFALLVYASAWLKCHHPDAFLAALLNSQPMGFYAPAQLVRDARAHGVDGAAGGCASQCRWDCTLEPAARPCRRSAVAGAAWVRTASAVCSKRRRAAARGARRSALCRPGDLARRAALDAGQLASAGAGRRAAVSITGHRHQAAWAGGRRRHPRHAAAEEHAHARISGRRWRRPSAAEDDAGRLPRHRPVAHAPSAGAAARAARDLQGAAGGGAARFSFGRLARASGLVTHRQRPETAKGVVFVTLEDETGAVNVIVWPDVAEVQRKPLLGSTLLTVYGVWQREGEASER